MFKFAINQHVWFLISDPATEEDPEYLEGTISKRFCRPDLDGSDAAVYEIQVKDGDHNDYYDRGEEDIYESFDELREAVTDDLEYWISQADQRVKDIKEELAEARVDKAAAEKRLRDWNRRCRKVGSHAT